MVFRGRVKGGVIELDGGPQLPDGTRVRVEPENGHSFDGDELGDVRSDPIWNLGRNPVAVDVTDASTNLDDYIYDGR